MPAHIIFTVLFFAIPIGGVYLVWDTYPRKSEEDDL
jgi:hypothetical protein